MPKSGDINTVWGVYRNSCCGREIIIREGATFPPCEIHDGDLATTWIPIDVEVADLRPIPKPKKPAA
jgi:hypothetical protein